MRNATSAPKGWLSFIRTLARDAKLKIVIGNNVSPATNGKVMWLPALPAELTPDDLVLFEGNAFHEVGHIQRSNINFFQEFSKEHGSFAQFLLNALDDVFMEGRQAVWKKMAANRLLDSTMVLIKRDQFRDGSAGLGEAVACYCLSYLTAKRWPTVGVVTVRIEANLRKHLARYADKVIPELRNLLDAEFPAVASTEDGGALALKIIDLLHSLAEQERSQPSSSSESGEGENAAEGTGDTNQSSSDDDSDSQSEPKGEDTGTGSDDDADPEGSDEGKGTDEKSESEPRGADDDNQGAGDSESEQEGKAEGQDGKSSNDPNHEPDGEGEGDEEGDTENAGSKSNSNSGKPEFGEGHQGQGEENSHDAGAESNNGKSLKEMIDDMLNENLGNQEVFDKGSAIEELGKSIKAGANPTYKNQPLIDGLVIDYSAGAGKAESYVDGMPMVTADREMAAAIAQVTGRKANVMGNRLRALLANREETESYAARSGQLCDRNLYRFALNDTKVFAKAEEHIEETAAVSITADLSLSTGVQRDGSSVAEQIRIALTMIEKVLHEIGTPREILGFAPGTGELNCMVKSFGDNHRVALDRIAGMHRLVGGGSTPIGAAVLQAGSRLLSHEAQRKLLLVVTDGRPDDENHACQMTSTILRSGTEVIYLVIGDESACDWLKAANIKFAHAQNAEGIIPAMVSKMAEFLA
jgi:cobalamin biosynthesis protein CobT